MTTRPGMELIIDPKTTMKAYGMMRALGMSICLLSVGLQMTACALADAQAGAAEGEAARLPIEWVDTNSPLPTGRTIQVPAGEDFQEALHKAKPGDLILLAPGVEYEGPFYLPKKEGDGWITIRSSASEASLPPKTRARPEQASTMPKLVAGHEGALVAQKGAHHYRFERVEIRPREGRFSYGLIILGDNTLDSEDLPHHFIFDRCFIHGDANKGSRRGIALNSRHSAVINSHLSDFKEVGADSNAILGWGGPGPYKIENNYLEGAGENLMFGGGADPKIKGLVPGDIEIRNNNIAKPLSWMKDHASYSGTPWQVKYLLELKNARRVLIDGNVLEYNWVTPGYGFAVAFTIRNENGQSPWAVIEDVTFTNNIVRHAPNGIKLLGRDDHYPSERLKRVVVRNNLFEDIDQRRWGATAMQGTLYQLIDGTANVVIEQNTGFQSSSAVFASGAPHIRFVYRKNIALHNQDGIIGSGTGPGGKTFEVFFPGAIVENNILIGGDAERYPRGNYFPESVDAVRFLDPAKSDYRLDGASQYRNIGVDMEALCQALGPLAQKEAECRRRPVAAE